MDPSQLSLQTHTHTHTVYVHKHHTQLINLNYRKALSTSSMLKCRHHCSQTESFSCHKQKWSGLCSPWGSYLDWISHFAYNLIVHREYGVLCAFGCLSFYAVVILNWPAKSPLTDLWHASLSPVAHTVPVSTATWQGVESSKTYSF